MVVTVIIKPGASGWRLQPDDGWTPAGNGHPIDRTAAAAFFPACITGSRCDLVSGLRGPPSVTAVAEELITGHVFRSAPSHTHTLSPTLETKTHSGHFILENTPLVLLIERKTSLNLLASVPVGTNRTDSPWGVCPPDQTGPTKVGVFRVLKGAI